jgi:preprotein translocase subunit SecE
MESIKLYIKESFNELVHNVTWPTWPELLGHTRLVLIAATIFALVTLIFDTVANTLLNAVYGLLN